MLKFKEIKEFAETLPCEGSRPLVFAPPYDSLLKSDSVLELFFPRGCIALSNYLRDAHGYLMPPAVLETITFSHLLDLVNGVKDKKKCCGNCKEVPPVFDPATHFQPEDLQPGEALSTFEVNPLDRKWVNGVATLGGPQIETKPYVGPQEAEWLPNGHANPLFCIAELEEAGRDIMMEKNHDYRGGSGDPYANFRGSEILGIHPIIGVLLRTQDKIMRIRTYVEKGMLKVKGEGIKDALVDTRNYMGLIWGLIKEEENAK
jgi:hypothetical protein